jgi:hypothetical protein
MHDSKWIPFHPVLDLSLRPCYLRPQENIALSIITSILKIIIPWRAALMKGEQDRKKKVEKVDDPDGSILRREHG